MPAVITNISSIGEFIDRILERSNETPFLGGSPRKFISKIYIYKGNIPSSPDHLLYTSDLYNSGSPNDLLLTFDRPIFSYPDQILYPTITSTASQTGIATWGAYVIEGTYTPSPFNITTIYYSIFNDYSIIDGSPQEMSDIEVPWVMDPSNKEGISILGLVNTSGIDYMFHLNTTNIIAGNNYTLVAASIKPELI